MVPRIPVMVLEAAGAGVAGAPPPGLAQAIRTPIWRQGRAERTIGFAALSIGMASPAWTGSSHRSGHVSKRPIVPSSAKPAAPRAQAVFYARRPAARPPCDSHRREGLHARVGHGIGGDQGVLRWDDLALQPPQA